MSSVSVASAAGIGLIACTSILAGVSGASAASPAYCALYAREYASQFAVPGSAEAIEAQRVQDQAYYRCLNLDEDPEFPTTSAYFGQDFEDVLAGAANVAEGDANPDDLVIEPPDEPAAAAAPKPQRVASSGKPRRPGRGSGYDAWSPEWFDWCEAHYRSFNPDTGMVKTYGGTRKLCP